MEGIPQTAGAQGQCLLSSKELTSKVKISRDVRLAVIPADTVDNPRVGWIAIFHKHSTVRSSVLHMPSHIVEIICWMLYSFYVAFS